MSLLTQPPVVSLATETVRTHQLRLGTEVVQRDGASAFVSEVGGDGRHIFVQLTNGEARPFRRSRRWRVIAPQPAALVPFLSVS